MGPRSDERGNAETKLRTQWEAEWLQWGRAPMSAEIGPLFGSESGGYLLQWGRAPMSAEICISRCAFICGRGSFNGAALR